MGAFIARICSPILALLAFAAAAAAAFSLFASIPVALLWRSRRYLADATAVQLTRNPTGLYRALVRLAADGAAIPNARGVAHLFVMAPAAPLEASSQPWYLMEMHPSVKRRLGRLARMGATEAGSAA